MKLHTILCLVTMLLANAHAFAEIDSFEEVAVEGLFFGAEMGEIVEELFGVDDAFPGSFVEFGHKVIDIFIEQIIMEVDMIKNSTKKG